MKKNLLLAAFLFAITVLHAEDGYRLWLRYDRVENKALLNQYRALLGSLYFPGNSLTHAAALRELDLGLSGLLGTKPRMETASAGARLVIGLSSAPYIRDLAGNLAADSLGAEGFLLRTVTRHGIRFTVLAAQTEQGLLYGVFDLLRLVQTQADLTKLNRVSRPHTALRMLDHWDNLNRTVERGYAGISIWNWHTLPGYIDQQYIDYARANASVGINGTVLTNVNANALALTTDYLKKAKALADVFRPYGIRVYLTAKFSAPVEIGGLPTADPLEPAVQRWWQQKADEIYALIPDFGGFLVKANSEGQPGPQTYGRTHAEGANMLADALAPHGGIVLWRAFVYDVRAQKSHENFDSVQADKSAPAIASADRFRQAFSEFLPLDGSFRNNVIIQVKNGPIDFQPREPFSPLLGAMHRTPLLVEFQLTQEYLGQGTHLVYEAPLFRETLDADTYRQGTGSTVAGLVEGRWGQQQPTGLAGVANIGSARNWTGHPFGQANWYAFGRLAWDPSLSAETIAHEWIRQTFSNEASAVRTITQIMLASREAVVNYMTPLGLHHIMATGHHYGPGPWVNNLGRADWNPVYYHRADSFGIGFDRTASGSHALAQYAPEVQARWSDSNTCDERYLLWFHHVSWRHRMPSGRTLWEELCYQYQQGVDTVRRMRQLWQTLKGQIDAERFAQVDGLLGIQEAEAAWWRNACLLYFGQFAGLPLPPGVERPDHNLDYYQSLRFPYAPGTGGNN